MMPRTKIIYIPRSEADAKTLDKGGKPSLYSQAEKWKSHVKRTKKDKEAVIFYLKCLGQKFPGNSDDGDQQIYIYAGHGKPGFDGAGWPGDPELDGANTLTSKQIAERINGEGWNGRNFAGRVKIYSCHSLETGRDQNGVKPSFASLVASEMRNLGWKTCDFFGYDGEITQVAEELSKIKKMSSRAAYPEREENQLEGEVKYFDGQHKWSIKDKTKHQRAKHAQGKVIVE